jgi:hypothetical protein
MTKANRHRTYCTAPDADSGEAERLFRREAERHSVMNPNTIGASDAGISIVQEVFGFVKRNLSGARTALRRGLDADLPRPQFTE